MIIGLPLQLRRTAVVALCLVSACGAVHAKPIPFQDRTAQITAREQPLAGFLQDLFSGTDIRVSVSPSIKATVNGQFSNSVEKIYGDIQRSFNLVGYYDGSVLHVCAPQDMLTRTLSLSRDRSDQVRRMLAELDLADARNHIRSSANGALMVSGTRRFVEQVEEIAKATGPSVAAGEVRVFRLRYAWAQDVTTQQGDRQVLLPGVASIVRAMMIGQSRSQVVAMSGEPPTQGNAAKGRANDPSRRSTLGSPDAGSRLTSAPGATQGTAGAIPPAASEPADNQPVRVEAVAGLNAVLVRDAPHRMPQYEALIAELDVEPMSVEIEASIIDVNTDKMRELGISWRYTEGRGSVLFGRGDSSDVRLTPATPVGSIVPTGAGGLVSSVLGNANQFISIIRALEEQGAAKVVTRPQVLALSNVEATFATTQEITVPVAGHDTVDVFTKSAGTTLRVTPHVFREGSETRIKMQLAIEDGSLSSRNVANVPVINRAAINTQAMIYEGESLLVGGITRIGSMEAESKVPGLGDIPWLGALFRSKRTNTEHMERMVLLTPRLAGRRAAPVNKAGAPTPPPPPPPPRQLQVQDRRGPKASYGRGERYEVQVDVPQGGFLYCYLIDERLALLQFFPNPQQRSAAVNAGSTLVFPGKFGFELQASRNAARETVACMHTAKDLGYSPITSSAMPDADTLARQLRQLAGDELRTASFEVSSD